MNRTRPILPAQRPLVDENRQESSTGEIHPETSSKLTRKRSALRVACEPCRKRKERCNGERPVCSACTKKETPCIYTFDGRDEVAFHLSHESLQTENERWRELYSLLRRLPETQARQAFARIRDADDPITVLNFATQASFLVNSSEQRSEPSPPEWNPSVETLTLKTPLSVSSIRVHARPWTTVAGDGLVSQLISSFFSWDDTFLYPFIDRQSFLDDMRKGEPEGAKYCSPFLVNAICASQCFISDRAKAFSSMAGKDVGGQFLDEAKKLLDLEQGLVSLPTAQGHALIFTLSDYRGVDRAGVALYIILPSFYSGESDATGDADDPSKGDVTDNEDEWYWKNPPESVWARKASKTPAVKDLTQLKGLPNRSLLGVLTEAAGNFNIEAAWDDNELAGLSI
ncbi:hypothetical protein FZEAL_4532 [Fusarium zealandicum]|uniref:Zn(2)-C6 fungal-type domain-containing protein n=1 Tax=Fusarium zealandicum TaxID=1053134 RepID=A0A8H4UMB3_9HYPO|nr:hypothetical protein FZEAL_4532 [Fusarium zealandicum]